MDFLTLALCQKASGGIIPTKLSDLTNDAGYVKEAALAGLARQSTVDAALAGKQDALTFDNIPTENSNNPVRSGGVASAISSAITDAFAGISQFSVYRCGNGEYDPQTLEPTVASPDSLHIYLVPDGSNYREYIYVNNGWDLIGTTEIDLSGYVQEQELEDYVRAEDLPQIPTKVSELENDSGYLTNPRSEYLTMRVDGSASAYGPGYAGNCDNIYGADCYDPTEDEAAAFIAAIEACEEKNICLDTSAQKLSDESSLAPANVSVLGYNVKLTECEAPLGFDRVDENKPCYAVVLTEREAPETGWTLMIFTTEDISNAQLKVFEDGAYLTEHQSLAGYAKTADVNAALAGKQDTLQFDDAPVSGSTKMLTSGKIYNALAAKQNTLSFDNAPTQNSGNPVKSGGVYTALAGKSNTGHTHAYSELTGKPTIPTVPTISTNISSDGTSDTKTASPKAVKTYVDGKVPTNLVTGDGASYTIKVSTSAPASGTASSIITIVVPE